MRWATRSALSRRRITASCARSSDSLVAALCANARKDLITTRRRHPEMLWIADRAGPGSRRVGADNRLVAAVVGVAHESHDLPPRKADPGAPAGDRPVVGDARR